jgi:hypothetical protein
MGRSVSQWANGYLEREGLARLTISILVITTAGCLAYTWGYAEVSAACCFSKGQFASARGSLSTTSKHPRMGTVDASTQTCLLEHAHYFCITMCIT